MRGFVHGTAQWMEAVARASGGAVLRTDDIVVVDEHSPHLLFNTGVVLRPLDAAAAEKVVADVMGFFAGAGGPYSLFCAFPIALPGLGIAGHPPLMLRPAGGDAPPVPAELEITVVTTREELEDYERVLVDGFPLDELQAVARRLGVPPGERARARHGVLRRPCRRQAGDVRDVASSAAA